MSSSTSHHLTCIPGVLRINIERIYTMNFTVHLDVSNCHMSFVLNFINTEQEKCSPHMQRSAREFPKSKVRVGENYCHLSVDLDASSCATWTLRHRTDMLLYIYMATICTPLAHPLTHNLYADAVKRRLKEASVKKCICLEVKMRNSPSRWICEYIASLTVYNINNASTIQSAMCIHTICSLRCSGYGWHMCIGSIEQRIKSTQKCI